MTTYVHDLYMYINLYMVCTYMYRDIHVTVHEFKYLYVRCAYICILGVNTCLHTVQTRLCSFTTTFNFQSAVTVQRLRISAPHRSSSFWAAFFLAPLFNWQTTQVLLATPNLLQPQVHLICIAATPAISCCSVTAAHRTGWAVLYTYSNHFEGKWGPFGSDREGTGFSAN